MTRILRRALPAATVAVCSAAVTLLILSSVDLGGSGAGAQPGVVSRIIPVAMRTPAPALEGPLLESRGAARPGAYEGDVVVLAFWSSWCTPCRAELRQLQIAWRMRAPSLKVLGVDVDDGSGPARAALRAAGATFPNVSDPSSSLAVQYHLAGTPTLVVIDPSGREAATALGPIPAAAILALARQVSGRQPYRQR